MKQVAAFIRTLFKKRKNFSSVISEAMAEGIRDTLKEMGYKEDNNSRREKGNKKDVESNQLIVQY